MDDEFIVQRRMRNRVIEYLEVVAEAERDVPPTKTADIASDWEFFVSHPVFLDPPYSQAEALALEAFAIAWGEFCDDTPDWPETYAELFKHSAWPKFRDAAKRTAAVLRLRGKLPEE